jgi:hypothetical protein
VKVAEIVGDGQFGVNDAGDKVIVVAARFLFAP